MAGGRGELSPWEVPTEPLPLPPVRKVLLTQILLEPLPLCFPHPHPS